MPKIKMKLSPQLSLDIQEEIIKRFPVKSLIQFRSVCKAWKSLIDSSRFIAGYSFRSQHVMIKYEVGDEDEDEEEEVKYVCFVDDDTFPQQKFFPTVPPLVQGTDLIIGSSHGLFCFSGYSGETHGCWRRQIAVIWNPAIRKSVAVDVPDVVHGPFGSVLGFGVVPDTKDPKLVKIITFTDDDEKRESIMGCIPFQVMVFTLRSGEWRCLCSNRLPRKSMRFHYRFQTVIGQFIYWLVWDRVNEDDTFRKVILSFNLSTDEFREIDVPDSLCENVDLSVSRLRGSLVLLDHKRNFTNLKAVCCDVWMMDHGDSKAFTKVFTFNISNASYGWPTLGSRKSGEPIVEIDDDNVDLMCPLVVYEPCLEHIKDLGIRGNSLNFSVNSYTESLLLLDQDDGRIVKKACEEVTLGNQDTYRD